MKKIAIDAREFTTTTGRYMYKLVENLQQLDAEHEYYLLLTPNDYASWTPRAPNFHKVECPYKEFTFAEQLGFCWQLYRLRVDLVHFGMTHQPILYFRRAVTTVHDLTTARFYNPSKQWLVFKLKQWVYIGVIWIAAHKSRRIVVPTRFVRDDLHHFTHVPTKKITVTYESSDPIPDRPAPLDYLTNKRFIMYLGRPLPHKNLERLLDAFQLLQKDHPALHLVLAGKKSVLYERIKAIARDKGIQNIVFTGFVSEGEMRWLYEHCAVYVFPSLSEGFGLPALEAMRHGAPVASSNATCLPELYEDAVLYFDPLSVSDMATAISRILNNNSLQRKLIKAGQAQADKYSWQRMAAQTMAVYQRVLSKT